MKENNKKILIFLIIVLSIINIMYIINSYNKNTYIIFNYDNVLQINKNNQIKKIKINKIKNLNFTNSFLLEDEKLNGYIFAIINISARLSYSPEALEMFLGKDKRNCPFLSSIAACPSVLYSFHPPTLQTQTSPSYPQWEVFTTRPLV